MKKYYNILIVAIVLIMTGCGVNMTTYQNPIPVTKVDLCTANYRVKRYVSAEVGCKYIFGIGGLSKQNLKTSAINEMYKKAALSGSETMVNVNTVLSGKTILGIYTTRTAIASGYVIEFVPQPKPVVVNPITDVPAVQEPAQQVEPKTTTKTATKPTSKSNSSSNTKPKSTTKSSSKK